MEHFIEFKDVKKIYQMGEIEIEALSGISFSIEEGDFVIIVGSSGAGKSTILNILGGMDRCSSGTITVDGTEVSAMNDKELTLFRRNDIGFVFQFYNLVPNLTAQENVELATQISKDPLDIQKTIEAVGLQDRKKNFPAQLSGGEQQRVAIARAVAKNPKLLLCDEPTGALDYQTGKQILKMLQDMNKERKMTVIVITHNLALAPMGNKVIRVKSGLVDAIDINKNPKPVESIEW
jgi:ABC-type antimicrobial peptide transport system, ATPase component